MISFIDGLLIGILIVMLITKMKEDKKMEEEKIVLTKEQAKNILEVILKEIDDDLPIEVDDQEE